MSKRWLAVAIFVVSFFLPTSLALLQDDARRGGTVVVMQPADVASWDYFQTTWPSMIDVDPLYDTLLVMDANENLQPSLATAWEISDDGLEYTFHLRDDVTFHDGTPFNADAVIYNVQRHIDGVDSASNVAYSRVVSMEAVDDYTVKITIDEPNGDFIYDVAAGTGSHVVSPTAYAAGREAFAQHPVGTGPFMFESYEPQSEIRYVRNENYWGGAPYLDALVVRINEDNIARVIELQSGSVDYVDAFLADDAIALQEDSEFTVLTPVTPGVSLISFNVSRPPTSELAVRQAIAHAIDFDKIIQEVYFGFSVRSRGGVTPNSPYYTEDLPAIPAYDPELAKQILEDAGWALADDGFRYRDGEKLVVNIISTDFADWGPNNVIYQQALTEIGIDAPIKTMEWNAMLTEWRENQGDWNMGHHSQGCPFAVQCAIESSWKPEDFWTIDQLDDATEPDLVEVRAQLQDLADRFVSSVDLDERKAIAHEAQTIFMDQQLSVWGWHSPWFLAYNNRVKDIHWTYGERIPQFDKAYIEE
jgi:peptide/nickel transport system substrate-binding protein